MITPARSRTSAPGRALEVAQLARRQLVVDDDDGGAQLPGGRGRRLEVRRFGLFFLFLFFGFFSRFRLAWRTLGNEALAAGPGGQLFQLALAQQRGSPEALALLRHLADDLEAERLGQALELLQRRLLFGVGDAWKLHADEHRLWARGFGGG